jgi:hypothetical protein
MVVVVMVVVMVVLVVVVVVFDFCPIHKSVDWTDQKQSSRRISTVVRR